MISIRCTIVLSFGAGERRLTDQSLVCLDQAPKFCARFGQLACSRETSRILSRNGSNGENGCNKDAQFERHVCKRNQIQNCRHIHNYIWWLNQSLRVVSEGTVRTGLGAPQTCKFECCSTDTRNGSERGEAAPKCDLRHRLKRWSYE
jgi:hypothetical protein